MEKERREYFYNPWLLQLLYTRVLFIEQLLALYQSHHTRYLSEEAGRSTLLCKRNHASLALCDVCELARLAPQGVDWADVCFEQTLYRLAWLCHSGTTTVPFHARPSEPGELWACEQLVQSELQLMCVQPLFMTMLLRYIDHCYIQCDDACVARRYALFANAKHTMEQAYARRYNVADLCVEYGRPLITSALLCVLLEELRADVQLQSRLATHPLSQHTQPPDVLAQQLALCELLLERCRKQYYDEFCGFAVVQSLPLWHQNGQYTLTHNPMPTIWQVHETETQQKPWHFAEQDTGPHRYLCLARPKHVKHYLHIARRFLFDCALRRLHSCDCTQLAQPGAKRRDDVSAMRADDETYTLRYSRVCHVCRYFTVNHELDLFYKRCEQEQCGNVSAVELNNRALSQWLLRPLGGAKSLVCWLLAEVQTLFLEARYVLAPFQYCHIAQCESETPGHAVGLFQMLDLLRLFQQMSTRLQACCLDKEAEALLQRSGMTVVVVTQAQAELGMRATLFQMLLLCVCEQQVEIESYERSLNNVQFSVNRGSSRHLHKDVCDLLRGIGTHYMETLKKV